MSKFCPTEAVSHLRKLFVLVNTLTAIIVMLVVFIFLRAATFVAKGDMLDNTQFAIFEFLKHT